jgi:hypothetical protein
MNLSYLDACTVVTMGFIALAMLVVWIERNHK